MVKIKIGSIAYTCIDFMIEVLSDHVLMTLCLDAFTSEAHVQVHKLREVRAVNLARDA